MEQQEKFNVFEVKCSDEEYQQICEPRLTKKFFDDCLKTAQKLRRNKNAKEECFERENQNDFVACNSNDRDN